MRMGDNIADAVTNDFGRIHDTTNCYVASPALFPALGSPNPMLTGVALARRTGDLLNGRLPDPPYSPVLFGPDPVISPQDDTGFQPLFDGTASTFKNWTPCRPPRGRHASPQRRDGQLRWGAAAAVLLLARNPSAILPCACSSAFSIPQTTTAACSSAFRAQRSASRLL